MTENSQWNTLLFSDPKGFSSLDAGGDDIDQFLTVHPWNKFISVDPQSCILNLGPYPGHTAEAHKLINNKLALTTGSTYVHAGCIASVPHR